jgi:hypothetical protein
MVNILHREVASLLWRTSRLIHVVNRRKFMRIAGPVVFMLVIASVNAEQRLSNEKQILKLEDDWARALKTKDSQLSIDLLP